MEFKSIFNRGLNVIAAVAISALVPSVSKATPFTTTVPGENIPLPDEYPEAGGVAIVMIGANGNVYYQFSDPAGAFNGFQLRGRPTQFRGNPFTINDPISLDCGFRSCTDYFGGSIDRMYVRFSAYDGDTQDGNGQRQGFDFNRINLVMNGVDVGNWSDRVTEITNNSGTQSFGFQTGFGNNSFNTGWFSTTNQTLLNNVLATGQTTTQVRDDTPDDNYWDFRRGTRLANGGIASIAPGYEFEKTADVAVFGAVGETITFSYVVSNIGSVKISDISVFDDQIGTVVCPPTELFPTDNAPGNVPESLTCTASYVITQEDFDNQSVTNIASANGRPEFGSLGEVTDTVTVTGPAFDARFTVEKEADRAAFAAVNEQIDYTYTVTNTGDATLSNIRVTDDKIPGSICTIASLPPAASAPANVTTCSATYTVTQDDLDDFARDGTLLTNVATVTAQDPNGVAVTAPPATETVSGPAAQPSMVVAKSALQPTFGAVGDVIQFEIEVINTGNVTWPTPPTITDTLITNAGGTVTCPAGEVAPQGRVVCEASYSITQPDLDAGEVENIAVASITVGGQTAGGQGDVTVPATVTRGMTIVKRLPAGDDTTFDATTDEINYEYVLTNTGTVTLLNPTIADDKVTASCAATSIAPGSSIVCTSDAPYDVEQSDLDLGSVTNIASGSAGTLTGDTVDTDDVSLTVTGDQMPELLMEKSAPTILPVDFVPGLMIEYTYTITNTGNTTITDQLTVSDDKIGAPFNCGSGDLAPTGVRTCTAMYEVTDDDAFVDGFVTNRATATDGTTTSNEDTQTVPQNGSPALGLTKAPAATNPTFNALNQPLEYVFTVQNTGDTTLIFPGQPVTIDDPRIATVTCAQPASFGPGDTFDCTGTYTGVTQAELDAGEVLNTATASFTAPSGTITSPIASATIPTAVVPAMTLAKDGPASFGAVGSTVTYTFTLTNGSPQTISTASVTDAKIPSLVCDFTDIPGNSSVSCQGDYTVTQADLDSGSIDNVANADGMAPTGELLSATASETITADPAALVRSLALDKTADVASFAAVGDEIDYTFAVTNTGTLTLTNITVSDPTVGLTCVIPSLAPMQTNDTLCQARYLVVQDDLDRGNFENTATVTAAGVTPDGDDTDTVDTPGPTRTSEFSVEKTADDVTDVQVNQVITYSHVVTNDGNTTLTNINLTDTHTSASGTTTLTFTPSNVIATLAPKASVTVTTTYTVTQDDIDAQADLTNTVTATATPVSGLTPPTATDDETVDLVDPAPALTVAKTQLGGSGNFGDLPTTETFDFVVTNTGNITLTGFTLTDDLTGFSCVVADVPVGGTATQCVNGDPLRTTYTVQQSDIDSAGLTNDVTVTDGTLTATDRVTLDGPTQTIVLTMVKTATAGDNFSAVGDVVSYDYVVTNDAAGSNVTIVNPISIVDDRTTVTCPALPVGGLPVGDALTCTATYTITQPDLDAGNVLNRATASVTQALSPDAATNGPSTITSPEATENVTADQDPNLEIQKVQSPTSATTFTDPLDPISYDFTITNTGNVTIAGPITVNDDQIGNGLACGAGPLEVGESITCTHVWPATQIAIDAGQITNTASAIATFGGNPVPTNTDSVTVLAIQNSSLNLVKALVSIEANEYAAGRDVTYSFTVTNDGNTTITTEPVISDSLITNAADITIDAPFPVGGMLPGDVITYTGTYELTLADVQLGSVTNTASATSGTTTSPPSSVTTPDDVDPAISVTKTTDATGFLALNDPIVYTYTVENTSEGSTSGGVTVIPALANPITITDDKFPGQQIACDPAAGGQLRGGETTTCTATYLVTQADLDAGEVTNSAFAETTFGGSNVFSPVDDVTVTGAQTPLLNLAKEVVAGPNPANVNDDLTYRLTASNDGNQTLSNVAIVDDRVPALTCTVGGVAAVTPVSLLPGQALVCEGDYTVTQDDLDLQDLPNTANASAINPAGLAQTSDVTLRHPLVTGMPDVLVIKDLASGEPGSAYSAVGEQLTYLITVRNTGTITLNSTTVTDTIVPGTCTIGVLAPGAEDTSCEFIYTVTQEDIDNGSIENTVNSVSQPATPDSPTVPGTATLIATGPDAEPALSMSKVADITTFDADDVLITYSYTVANTGNITLTVLPEITDDKIDNVTCPPLTGGELRPDNFIICTATYLTTQEDVDNGGVTNIATVSSSEAPFDPNFPGNARATETVPSDRTPAFVVTKTADETANLAEGETVTYSYLIENTGNVTLTGVTLDDQHTSASGTAALTILPSATIASLAPNTDQTLTATYVITQADVDAGAPLTNIATVNASTQEGPLTPVTDTESVTPEVADPEITALKTVSGSTGTALNDTVTFDITVRNTGNVTLDGITLADTLRRQNGELILPAPVPALSDGDGGTLSPGEIWTYQITHTLTQDDIDSGGLSNSALATGTPPSGPNVTDVSDTGTGTGSTPTPFAIPSMPQLTTEKTVSVANTAVDETVVFEITVLNSGNVTLNTVSVADTLTRADTTALTPTTGPTFAGADQGSAEGDLLVGETATYVVTYQLTQADVDAGGITNTATSTGTPPTGSPVTDPVDVPAELPIAPAPSITMVKTLTAGGPTFDEVGDILEYAFTVTNTGNITITDPIDIADALITDAGGAITCPAPPLAPMGVAVCTAQYSVTQGDLDAGEVLNSATATVPDATPVTDDVTVPSQQNPALTVDKQAELVTTITVGQVVTYTYTVTNTGNVTLTDAITVSDNLIPNVVCDPLPTGGLLRNDTLECSGDYTVTDNDVDLQVITNLATATSGDTDSPQVSETIPRNATPALSISKSITAVTDAARTARPDDEFVAVGDLIEYAFEIENTGTQAFINDIPVIDDRFPDPIECYVSAPGVDFEPTETQICTATYEVTQEDLDAGDLTNTAFAQTTFGGGTPITVTSPPDSVTASVGAEPMIEVVKAVDNATYAAIDDVLTYTFTVTNTGNQTLRNVVVTDVLIPTLDCSVASLAPMGVQVCTDTITITQAELDNASVENMASVTGITPVGGSVTDDSDPVISTAPTTPSVLTLVKSATPDPFGGVGTSITYGFAVTNDGPFTLENVEVTDPLVAGFSCTIARLPVGQTDTTCRMPYTVTQADVDAGSILNEATATGTSPAGLTSTATDEITTPGPAIEPSLEVIKTASVPATTVGSIVTYTVTVENTGNVTLLAPSLVDSMERIDTARPTFLTTPFVYQSGDAGTPDRLDVDEVWTYTATYQLTQSDVNAGGVSNSVTATAVVTTPDMTSTSDTSDDGIDANGDDNPTLVPIVRTPVLDVVKSITTSAARPGETVTFRIEAFNRGNVSIENVQPPVDTLTRRGGTDISAAVSAPVLQASTGNVTSFDPGLSLIWEVTYELTQEDVDAGGIENLATVTGTSPTGDPVTATSSDDDPTDGNPAVDPTELVIAPTPSLDTVKVDVSAPAPTMAGDTVTYTVTALNTGNVTLSDVTLADTFTNLAGDTLTPDSITPSPMAGVTLEADDDIVWTVNYTLTQDDIDAGGVSNTATATGLTPTLLPVSDTSDDGIDTDGNTVDDPTETLIAPDNTLIVNKVATTPARVTGTTFETAFTITVQNDGNVTQTNLSVVDDMTAFVAPATLISVSAPDVSGPATVSANAGYDGVAITETLAVGSSLLPGETATIVVTVRYDVDAGAPGSPNTASVTTDRVTTPVTASVSVAAVTPEPDVLADKTITSAGPYLAGSVVDYQITFTNRNDTPEIGLSLIDLLPVGMTYVPDSALYNGAATPAPVQTGRLLTWEPITLAPAETVTITLSALLLDGAGSFTNTAYALDSTGVQVSNTAAATIDVAPEAVFDCGDVIGKVFDDRNGNGYQDAPNGNPAISDQTFDGGKFDVAPATVDQQQNGEPGIPGVKIVTVRGDIITTDEYGRFSVPCALLPGPTGSNFTLKLDERSLPTGFRVTTENPRTMRLTSGIMTEMNFGASLANLVDIDLLAAAFDAGSTAPNAALVNGVEGLVAQIAQDPSVLRLTYYTNGESDDIARARLAAAEALIRDRWRGRYSLRIETTIARVQ